MPLITPALRLGIRPALAGWPALVLALALLLPLAGTVAAADAPSLDSQLTDQTGVLKGRETEITTALDRLLRDHNVQLWVLFVPTTNGTNVTTYAEQVAAANSLGVNDALLVVALDGSHRRPVRQQRIAADHERRDRPDHLDGRRAAAA